MGNFRERMSKREALHSHKEEDRTGVTEPPSNGCFQEAEKSSGGTHRIVAQVDRDGPCGTGLS